MSLREGAIELIDGMFYGPEAVAASLLDALLDYLTEHADEALAALPHEAENVGKAIALTRMSEFVALLREEP